MTRTPAKRYTLEEIELGLRTLALNAGNYERASQTLAAQGQRIPHSTLHFWATQHHTDRYHQIRSEIHQQVADRVASQAEEIMLQAGDLEKQLLAKLQDQIGDLDAKDAAAALRNVTTTKALNNDKISAPIRGRPTTIVENRDATQILQELQRLGVVEGTAEEIP